MDLKELEKESPFALGEENTGYAQYFDGKSYLNMLTLEQVPTAVVTFEPGCRNHWHIHHAAKGGGQILIVTAGRGYYQGSESRRCGEHPAGSEALARGGPGFRLPAPCSGSPRRRHQQ